jgi:uncharacterized membrane protein YhaH (DUF805 family)
MRMFSFKGRIGRLTYLGYGLAAYLAVLVSIPPALAVIDRGSVGTGVGVLLILIGFAASIWIGFAASVRRLHDLNMSGSHTVWMCALLLFSGALERISEVLLIPAVIAGFAVPLWLLLWPGTRADNEFGPAPVSTA